MSQSQSEHLLGAEHDPNTFMPDVWGYCALRFNVALMIDIGCGYGHCCKWFGDLGINVVGVDGSPACVTNTVCKHGRIVQHDFSKGPYIHGTPFDLAWSCEFLEHIEEKHLENLRPCFQAARYCVITHGEPHQDGSHHVNCRPDSYWDAVFTRWGFRQLTKITDLMRRTDRFRAAWGRRTLMAFERI